MTGKMPTLLTSLVLLLELSACAQAKYQSSATPPGSDTASTGKSAQDHLSACELHFDHSGNCLAWLWEKQPTDSDTGSLIFKVFRASRYDGTPVLVDLPSPEVVLWMPGMGHGSTPTTLERIDVGTYRASDVFFIMPGEWEIRFQFSADSSTRDQAIATLTR